MTARIEAIRERYSAEDGWFYSDMAYLLARDRAEQSEADYKGAVARIDEIERWALDHFGDTTEFPTDLAFAFWGAPTAAPDAEQRTRDHAAALGDEGGAT